MCRAYTAPKHVEGQLWTVSVKDLEGHTHGLIKL